MPNRSYIEIHSANFAGSVAAGKLSQLLGCIALGETEGRMQGQEAVEQSKQAISEFYANLNQEDFQLTIVRAA